MATASLIQSLSPTAVAALGDEQYDSGASAEFTLAYWHHPLFTSGPTAGGADNLATRPLWQALVDGGADVILNGHDHDYERFAPQDA